MIEYNIHQIWLQGRDKIPSKYNENIKMNKEYNVNWNYYLWDEEDITELLSTRKVWLKKYNSFKYLHQKVDFARYIILYLYGGIYIDMDAYTIKPIDILCKQLHENQGLIVCQMKLNKLESFITCNDEQCYNNGVILCKKGNHIMSQLIDEVLIMEKCKGNQSQMNCIQQTTGPLMFTRVVKRNLNDKTLKILEAEYLEPCFKQYCDITENTYVKHKHEQTWINSILNIFSDIYLFITRSEYSMCFNTIIIILIVLYIYVQILGKNINI